MYHSESMFKKTLILAAIIAIFLAIGGGASYIALKQEGEEVKEEQPSLVLSDYPKFFDKEVIIVIGDNASQIELESAQAISVKLEEMTGYKPLIESDVQITQCEKKDYNLIFIGTPGSNSLLKQIYEITDATRVTEKYPGKHHGFLEILKNPWNEKRIILLVVGSDKWGVRAGSEILQSAKELDISKVIVNWQNLAENKQAVALGLTPSEFKTVDTVVREYFYEQFSFLHDWPDFPVLYERVPKLEDKPGLKVIKAYGRFESPSPSVTCGFYNGQVYFISEELNPASDA